MYEVFDELESGREKGEPLDTARLAAPLPRAYQWLDGSAYVNHVELVRKARGAEMPASFWTDPLMYLSNRDRSKGSCCIAERRMLETLDSGAPKTAFMRFGDRVRIEMCDSQGESIFGAIDQRVVGAAV